MDDHEEHCTCEPVKSAEYVTLHDWTVDISNGLGPQIGNDCPVIDGKTIVPLLPDLRGPSVFIGFWTAGSMHMFVQLPCVFMAHHITIDLADMSFGVQ